MLTKRIAMWSGPRNLSTALLRSFASRNDCRVIDEPFYASYLYKSGAKHPMRDIIIKHYNHNPVEVAHHCTDGQVDTKIQYQKHMSHHMLENFDLSFILKLANAFLIRSPEKVVKSFGKKIENFNIYELGFIQQATIFNLVVDSTGIVPPVIDADDLSTSPRAVLNSLCSNLKIDFSDKMLSWEKGPHAYDGIWGDYWYNAVNKTTSFEKLVTYDTPPTDDEKRMINDIYPHFEVLEKHKLKF